MDPRFRRGNLVSIVKYISDRVQVSNSEIAGDLHMSMPTVLQHIKTLQTKGIVEETGKHRSSGGRRASLFTLKKDLAYAVGLDIKRDRQIFLIADMLGKTVYSCTCEVPYEDSFAYFEKIRRNLDAALTASGLQRSKVVGVGISLPGIVDVSRNLLLQSHALGVSNVSFQGVERLISDASHRNSDGSYRDRVIDIDIVAIDQLTIDSPTLKVPHPHFTERDFYLIPMCELAPAWRHPRTHLTPSQMLDRLNPKCASK